MKTPLKVLLVIALIITNILQTVGSLTNAEKIRLSLIYKIQEMNKKGYTISEISRLLGKDRRTIKKYIIGNPKELCKQICKRYNPYENKVIYLVKCGYIEKQIVNILMSEGYKRSISNARHMIRNVVKDNNLNINKYSPTINSIKTSNGARDTKYTYIKRNYIFKYLWMDINISEKEKEYIYKNYPKVFVLKKCINEFREFFKRKSLALLYLFIEKYKDIDITELASFTKELEKDLEAVENAVSSD